MSEKCKREGGDLIIIPVMIRATTVFHMKHDSLKRRAKELG